MFAGLRAGGFDVCDQAIPMPRPGETLGELAGRIAEQIAAKTTGDFVLGGASFGGMLASEMCAMLRPRALLQLGSALTGAALGSIVRGGAPLVEVVPDEMVKAPPFRTLAVRFHLGPMRPEIYASCREMFNATPTAMIRRGLEMILKWEGPQRIPCPVYRVHGGKDRLVRLMDGPTVIEGTCRTRVVEDAGHLVSMTHEEVVNRFVKDMLGELNGSR